MSFLRNCALASARCTFQHIVCLTSKPHLLNTVFSPQRRAHFGVTEKHMFQKSCSRLNGVHILAYLSGCHRCLFNNMFSKILLPPQRGAHSEATQNIGSACFLGSSAALGAFWVYWAVWGRSWMKFLSARHRLACSQPGSQPAS